MPQTAKKIADLLAKHHLLSLATAVDNIPQSASLFYSYDPDTHTFIVASDKTTQHIQNILQNDIVSGTVALETDVIGKIQGIQFIGSIRECESKEAMLYFEAFPYAKMMKPTLWKIELQHIKMTDNRLGFGKKLYWQREKSLDIE